MPSIPEYTPDQVQQAPVPNVRTDPNEADDAFGGGQAFQRTVGTGMSLIDDAKKRANDVAVLDADTKATNAEIDILHNPQTGALQKHGKDAFDLPSTVMDDFNKRTGQIASDLTPEQAAVFNRMASARRDDLNRTVQRHVAGEIQAYDGQVTDAHISAEREAAVLNPYDSQRVADAVQRQAAVFTSFGQAHGMDQSVIDEKVKGIESQTHAAVIERMLGLGKDLDAKNYFDNHTGQITANDTISLEQKLKAGSILGESQRFSNDAQSRGLSMGDAIDEAKEKFQDNPRLQQGALAQLREDYNLNRDAQREDQQDTFLALYNKIQNNKAQGLPAITPEMNLQKQTLLPGHQSVLDSMAAPGTTQTNLKLFYDRYTQATTPELQDNFASKVDLTKEADQYSDADFRTLMKLQGGIRSKDPATLKKLGGYRNDNQIVTESLQSAGLDPRVKSNTEMANQFRRSYDEQLQEYQDSNKKPATNIEKQNIADRLLIQVKTGTTWYGGDAKKFNFQVQPGDTGQVDDVNKIPRLDRSTIEQKLRDRNRPVTDDTVLNFYNDYLKDLKTNGR